MDWRDFFNIFPLIHDNRVVFELLAVSASESEFFRIVSPKWKQLPKLFQLLMKECVAPTDSIINMGANTSTELLLAIM